MEKSASSVLFSHIHSVWQANDGDDYGVYNQAICCVRVSVRMQHIAVKWKLYSLLLSQMPSSNHPSRVHRFSSSLTY
jgi:hypothetical protein